jgi:DNA-binding response OmpR family regulator
MNNEPLVQRILTVDDSRVIQLTVRRILEDAGYDVSVASSGEEALQHIRKHGFPHLALVDLNMPNGMDGFELCRKVHAFSDLPVIMLTAVDEESTVVEGLEQYAEDYIVKPFRSSELVARVRRVLARVGDFAYVLDPEVKVDDRLLVNLPLRQVTVAGDVKSLTPTEARLLYILMKNAGRTVRTEFLLKRVWPLEEAYEDRLHAHIYRLRKKIEHNPKEPQYIVSEWGTGYTFPVFAES